MSLKTKLLVLCASSLVATTACVDATLSPGGGSGSGTAVNAYPSGAPVPLEQLEKTLLEVMCTLSVTCEHDLDGKKGFATVEGCKAFMSTYLGSNPIVASITAGKVKYDPVQTGKCLQAAGTMCEGNGFGAGPGKEACKAAFAGTIAEGGTCESPEECVSAVCKKSSDGCPGKCDKPFAGVGGACGPEKPCGGGLSCKDQKCVAPSEAKIGEMCGNNACVKGAYCSNGGGDAATCKALGGVNAKCLGQDECMPELYCKPPGGDSQFGTCAARAKVGEPCGDSAMESYFSCLEPAICWPGTDGKGTCHAVGKLGSACSNVAHCAGVDLTCVAGSCKLLPKKGEACTPPISPSDQSFACLPPSVCVGNKCEDAPGEGKPCVGYQCAHGLYCDGAVCKQAPGKGQPCQGPCQKGLLCQPDVKGNPICEAPMCGTP